MNDDRPGRGRDQRRGESVRRWECDCRTPPFLLATYEPGGRIHVKIRDRYFHVDGRVWAVCPLCGAEHMLDPRPAAVGAASLTASADVGG